MAALGHTFPFYAGPKPNFPMVTTLAIIITIFMTSLVAFISILPGIRGKMRLFWILRVVTSLFIGAVILAMNFSSEWSVGQVSTNTSYKAFSSECISTAVGLQIGLGGVNITLTGEGGALAWEEGKASALRLWDLCWVFTPHSPCGLHGQYCLAGHYTSATLWVAFLCWLLADVMLSMPVLVYGGHVLLATGVFQLLGLLFFSTAMSLTLPCPLRLGTATLHTHRGPAYWITLTTGVTITKAGYLLPHPQACSVSTVGEDPVLEWDPEEGGLLSPRYRSTAESPEPQDIPLSEASSEVPCEESDCALESSPPWWPPGLPIWLQTSLGTPPKHHQNCLQDGLYQVPSPNV
uniref:Dual oxidase maturation factor 1 n=1 Tax=Monodon monoceros TaxID=40151 RepID=A0A8C6BFX3_MONMO